MKWGNRVGEKTEPREKPQLTIKKETALSANANMERFKKKIVKRKGGNSQI